MEKKNKEKNSMLFVGLMLFALFFGAGNLIFPPFLGQQSGTSLWPAITGFLITGVGLPLLGVIAVSRSDGDLHTLASRVNPLFGTIFTVVLYLTIGPFFGIPRTGTVAYEIGMQPFLPREWAENRLPIGIYTVIYFILAAWLSLNPSKLVDRIGKILTPALLVIIGILAVKSFITPLGSLAGPQASYAGKPFFSGFLEGYLTMDTIAALVFGMIVASSIKELGLAEGQSLTRLTMKAGVVAAIGLALVYLSLAWIGATSAGSIGMQENGGAILAGAAQELYGAGGAVILAAAITFACMTTSIGLLSATAQFLNKLAPKITYRAFVIALAVFSGAVAVNGLTALIKVSMPMLVFIYPPAIVLIILSLFHPFIRSKAAMAGALAAAGIVSLADGLKEAGSEWLFDKFLFLPLMSAGAGWVLPALAGGVIGGLAGLIWKSLFRERRF